MFVKQVRVESLGNSSYSVGSDEAKACAVVDPLRDVGTYIHEAKVLGVKITHSLETRVHNDFISGSRELAARTSATICASVAGGLLFGHQPLRKGDSITLGEVQMDMLATPGHTPEHISFRAKDTSQSRSSPALFSGGALLVGGVAPLLGRWVHRTIREELQRLYDAVEVHPTHGGGSFCLATPMDSGRTTSTIGLKCASSPYFQAATQSKFLDLATGDLPPYPVYYKRMAAQNRRGPRILGSLPTMYPLSPREVWVGVQDEGFAIDGHPAEAFGEAHIPSAYSIPFGGSFGTWVGWRVEPGKPLVLVTDEPSQQEEAVRQLVRIGYETLDEYLEGGLNAWGEARLPLARVPSITHQELHQALQGTEGPLPLDVRFGDEWRQIPEHVDGLPRDRAYATLCAAGIRASTVASILLRESFPDVTLVLGGTQAWKDAEYPIEMDKS